MCLTGCSQPSAETLLARYYLQTVALLILHTWETKKQVDHMTKQDKQINKHLAGSVAADLEEEELMPCPVVCGFSKENFCTPKKLNQAKGEAGELCLS